MLSTGDALNSEEEICTGVLRIVKESLAQKVLNIEVFWIVERSLARKVLSTGVLWIVRESLAQERFE